MKQQVLPPPSLIYEHLITKCPTCVILIYLGAFADFQIHIVPASRLVFEGQLLLFNCSVKGVPGPITLSWYKRDKLNKETKITKSSEAEFKISRVNSSDAGDYLCEANNSRRSFVSKAVTITIKGTCHQASSRNGSYKLRRAP